MKKKLGILLVVLCFILVGCDKGDVKDKDLTISDINENLFYASASEYSDEISDVIDKIKESEENFDISNYRLTYRIVNDESKSGVISLNYYINDKIRTNKIYSINFENYKLGKLELAGINEENIKNIDNTDINLINTKISEFESNKSSIIFKEIPEFYTKEPTLNTDKSLTKDNLSELVKDFNEYYYYDYNTNKLLYKVEITKTNPLMPEVESVVDKEIEL